MMRNDKQHKPDSLLFLCLLVSLGMIVTTVVQAENYLFGEPGVLSPLGGVSSRSVDSRSDAIPRSDKSWLLPGSVHSRASFKDGMAHIQFDSSDDSNVSSLLPVNTRLTLSMGLEDGDAADTTASPSHVDSHDWYERYRPMLYFSIGHRW